MRGSTFFLRLAAISLVVSTIMVYAQIGSEPLITEWMVGDAPENGWTVGDHIPLHLNVTYPAGMEVTLPELPAKWGAFEVVEQTLAAPTENENGTFTAVRKALVTLWAPGDYQTAPFSVRYQGTDDQLHESLVSPLTITVASVLEEGETEKRDLKPQASLAHPPLWPWLLSGLRLASLIGVVGWLLWTRLRRRPATAATHVIPIDTRAPEEIAYSELDRIAALNLPAQGELKHHYTLITDCMRSYVQGRYQIPALDRTTTELMTAFRRSHVDRAHVGLFRDLLNDADLVKFAKAHPSNQQANKAVTQARHIVDVTKIGNSA
jgi:hypothetical protein